MSKATMRLAYLIGDLRAVQVKMQTKFDYENADESAVKADERRTARLASEEDTAYSAIGRYQARNLTEFREKLHILFEAAGDQIGPMSTVRLPNGKIGGAGSKALADIVRGVQADAARLLIGDTRHTAA